MFSQIRYIIKKEIVEPLREISYAVIFGSKKITPIYSIQGLLTRMQFFAMAFILLCFYSIFNYFHNSLLTYIARFFLFCGILTSSQKRCRDFNSSGTLLILLISITFIINMSFSFIDIQATDKIVQYISRISVFVQLIVFLLLLFIPSKPNPDLKQYSLLLKYPFVYMLAIVMLTIIITIITNHFIF